jgi:hypothetical protein
LTHGCFVAGSQIAPGGGLAQVLAQLGWRRLAQAWRSLAQNRAQVLAQLAQGI